MKDGFIKFVGRAAILGICFGICVAPVLGEDGFSQRAEQLTFADQQVDRDANDNTSWLWKSGGELTLFANGQAWHTEWPQKGMWLILNDGTMKLVHPNGLVFLITFSDEKNGLVVAATGGQTTISLKE